MSDGQVGRRNLSPANMKWATGERYNLTKKTKADAGAEGGSKGKNCPCLPKPPNTAKAIGDMAGVSEGGSKIGHCGNRP